VDLLLSQEECLHSAGIANTLKGFNGNIMERMGSMGDGKGIWVDELEGL